MKEYKDLISRFGFNSMPFYLRITSGEAVCPPNLQRTPGPSPPGGGKSHVSGFDRPGWDGQKPLCCEIWSRNCPRPVITSIMSK